jgi:hypothetical protein
LEAEVHAVERDVAHLDRGDVGIVLTAQRPASKLASIKLL